MARQDPARRSQLMHELRLSRRVQTGLLALAIFAICYFARQLLIPVFLGLMVSLLLGLPVRKLTRFGMPQALGAALVLLATLSVVALLSVRLSDPAAEWLARLPQASYQAEYKLRELVGMVREMKEIGEKVEEIAEGNKGTGDKAVVVQGPGLASLFLGGTTRVLAMGGVTLVLVYFLLAYGDIFMRKLVKVLPTLSEKKRVVEIARRIEHDVSIYLLTITVINVGLGLVTAAVLFGLGVPSALLWGTLAALLNFIPYVGAIGTALIIALVSLLTFNTWLDILLPPLCFILLTGIEGYFVTPSLVGRRLTLNPVAVFLALLLWGWLWGAAGLILAVPLLVVAKILCDHIESLESFGEFLSSGPAVE